MKTLVLLMIIIIAMSCGSENKCESTKCDNWLQCNEENGKCDMLKDDFCLDDKNCDSLKKETCELTTHKCKLPHFTIEESIIIDNETNLMWQNSNIQHNNRDFAINSCNNMVFKTFDDWKLTDIKTLGNFHRETNKEGIVPKQVFAGCLAEVATDGYVKTKKGAEDYGGNPGDEFNFSGGANFRCVRENK